MGTEKKWVGDDINALINTMNVQVLPRKQDAKSRFANSQITTCVRYKGETK